MLRKPLLNQGERGCCYYEPSILYMAFYTIVKRKGTYPELTDFLLFLWQTNASAPEKKMRLANASPTWARNGKHGTENGCAFVGLPGW